jgi:hypothetical protein
LTGGVPIDAFAVPTSPCGAGGLAAAVATGFLRRAAEAVRCAGLLAGWSVWRWLGASTVTGGSSGGFAVCALVMEAIAANALQSTSVLALLKAR